MDSPVELPAGVPPELVEPDPVEHGQVRGVELRAEAEEVVQPEHAAGAQHPVDVEERRLEHGVGDPAAEHVHGVHQVQRAVGEGQPARHAEVHRHQPARRDEAVERPVEVHGRGHHGDAALPHPRRERPGPAADVHPDPHAASRQQTQHAVDGVVERVPLVVGVVVLLALAAAHPAVLLPAAEVEAVLAVVAALGLAAVHEAAVGLARVRVPHDAGVRRDRPQARRQRRRLHVPCRGARPAPPPRQRLAPLEHQALRRHLVGGALPAHRVVHVPLQLVTVPVARLPQRREHHLVAAPAPAGASDHQAPVRELVRSDRQLQLVAEVLVPLLPQPAGRRLPLLLPRRLHVVLGGLAAEDGLQDLVGRGEAARQVHHLGVAGGHRQPGHVELAEQLRRGPGVDYGRVVPPDVRVERRAGPGEDEDGGRVGEDEEQEHGPRLPRLLSGLLVIVVVHAPHGAAGEPLQFLHVRSDSDIVSHGGSVYRPGVVW